MGALLQMAKLKWTPDGQTCLDRNEAQEGVPRTVGQDSREIHSGYVLTFLLRMATPRRGRAVQTRDML
ncbi:hypothetical protein GGTG_12558 [Gaeumannomyces tritici R3-111a-1]|uniref:Uncharacterized protein n=1 Tax=Gaeumannomyces tritici (strain R3-111a-1) TaxID=644352 RepID=J3PGD4_GAET3|nr:hypothetical protein GGTG_12558 [Gaeumannomyces tritici R3-111a-1]EJT69675.1 hypothetical protein GGTG_12558 [Gaeumannomyces tritici R3-111a-1]